MQNSDNQSYMAQDNLRLEIAILQDDIKSQDPKCARFKIPAIMTGNEVGRTHASSSNSANMNVYRCKSNVTYDDTITLKVPLEHTAFFGKRIVPKGTKFIVAFIGGDINNIRIVGRYNGGI